MIDSIEYHLFPNMFLFPGISLADDLSLPADRHGPRPDPVRPSVPAAAGPGPGTAGGPGAAPPDPGESYADAPGMSQGLGFVYDQDTDNLAMQYKGMQASRKRGQTLGNYQEVARPPPAHDARQVPEGLSRMVSVPAPDATSGRGAGCRRRLRTPARRPRDVGGMVRRDLPDARRQPVDHRSPGTVADDRPDPARPAYQRHRDGA